MVVPPGSHPVAPRDSDLRRTCQYFAGFETQTRPASGSQSLQLGEKDGHVRGSQHVVVRA
jgi:hypothetical protein